jgi:hypothetical protein
MLLQFEPLVSTIKLALPGGVSVNMTLKFEFGAGEEN